MCNLNNLVGNPIYVQEQTAAYMKLQTEFDNYDWWEEDEDGGEGSTADKSADDTNVIKKNKDSSSHSLPRSRPPTRPPTREDVIERLHHNLSTPAPTTSHYITAAAVTEADEDNESDNTAAAVTTSPAAVSSVTSSVTAVSPASRIESADSQHSGSVHGSEPSTSSQEDLR